MDKDKVDKNLKISSGEIKKIQSTNDFWDFWAPLLLTIAFYSAIRSYIAEARYIPSGSMLPSLEINDRLLIEKITYFKRSPKRGEIVVFNSPYSFDKELLKQRVNRPPSKFVCSLATFPLISLLPGLGDPVCDAYIKRVVAIGGDHVFVNLKGQVFVNGNLITENYSPNYCSGNLSGIGSCKEINRFVPLFNVLVLGDNRSNSWDSRFWPGGPFLPESEIIGRAVWRFWPLKRIGLLNN